MHINFENLELFMYLIIGLLILALAGALLIRRDFITILVSIELLLLVSIIMLLIFTSRSHLIEGQLFTLFILVIAAAESSIILATIYNYYHANERIDIASLENDS